MSGVNLSKNAIVTAAVLLLCFITSACLSSPTRTPVLPPPNNHTKVQPSPQVPNQAPPNMTQVPALVTNQTSPNQTQAPNVQNQTPNQTAPPQVPNQTAYTINVASNDAAGQYLVDGKGRTLYYTVSDLPNKSNLPDETLTSWPVFYTGNVVVPPSLNPADFGTYTRDNNVKQTTYKGYPLYYFFQDKGPGSTVGNKLGGVWFVVTP